MKVCGFYFSSIELSNFDFLFAACSIVFMLKVFGHLSPDTDTTCCAILWAWHLNEHTSHKATPFVLGALNKETIFVLKRWGIDEPSLLESVSAEDEVVIVDTNNPAELFSNINDSKIVQVIDHHRLVGGLSTIAPIEMTLRPLASTATVIYDLIGQHVEVLPEDIAGLFLSCILSDTLAFRSPTTTPHDKAVAEKLATMLGLDITTYSDEMFKAKSDLSDFTDIGLVHLDSKKVDIGDITLRVSVVETTDPQSILERKDAIVTAIKGIIGEEHGLSDILFYVVDIMKEESTVLAYNQFIKDVMAASFGVTADSDLIVLPGIVSRKKQILPALKLPEGK
jgi:manganese-dependent inorganic pyrophosphatase